MKPENAGATSDHIKAMFTSVDFLFPVIFESVSYFDSLVSESVKGLCFQNSIDFDSALTAETHSSCFSLRFLEEEHMCVCIDKSILYFSE